MPAKTGLGIANLSAGQYRVSGVNDLRARGGRPVREAVLVLRGISREIMRPPTNRRA